MSEKFYITTAIAYVNGKPHMGHALEFIMEDVIARYKRLMGFDVFCLTGTDENGTKIYNTAKANNMDTQEFVDMNAEKFLEMTKLLNLSNDDFIRTTDQARHWPTCQKLWNQMLEKGDLYEKEYEGLYCEGCEAFMNERDLVDGNCPNHLKPPTLIKEKNYFFKLSKYSEKIVSLIETEQLKIIPSNRKHEFLNLAREGLHDVSFSRPKSVLPWGVEVPNDPSQVMYVWCDALTNYISALRYHENSPLYKKYWPADVQVIGKDIVRFHAGVWIGMLLSAGLPIPKSILVHGFLTHNGQKMSKSLGNVVDPVDVVDRFGTDALRYYFTREIPCGRDGDFSDDLFINRYNADLANNLGNLVNRLHTLISRNEITDFTFEDEKEVYQQKVNDTWKKYVADMDKFNLHEAVFHVWRLVDFANKMMEKEKPWSLVRTDPARAKAVLCNLLELVRHVSIMVSPIIPHSAGKIRMQIGLPREINIKVENGWGVVEDWKRLGEQEMIFPRIEIEKEVPQKKEYQVSPVKIDADLAKKGLKIKMAIFNVPANPRRQGDALKKHIKSIIQTFNVEKMLNSPILEECNRWYESVGIEEGIHPSVHLLNIVQKSGSIPNISRVVDCYNIVSAETLLSLGAHDLARIKGDLRLVTTDGSEKYMALGVSEPTKVNAGEYAMMDDEKIICRLDLKQCEETKVTDATTDFIVYVQGNKEASEADVAKALDKVCYNIQTFCGGSYKII